MKVHEELAGLRRYLKFLKSPATFLTYNRKDVKQREIRILEREIAHLEKILRRGAQNRQT